MNLREDLHILMNVPITPIPAQTYVSGDHTEQFWRYEVPCAKGVKMQLKTVGGVCVIGQWYGELNQHFVAWAPLLK